MPRESRDRDADRDTKPRTTTKDTPARISLASADAIESGLFSSGPATVKESIWCDFKYPTGEKAQVWLVTYTREGEAPYEQPYTLGKGWRVDKAGNLIALAGQAGLPKNCNAIQHLIASLERNGVSRTLLESGDPTFLEGAEVIVKRVPQQERTGLTDKPRKGRDGKERSGERTILEIEEIVSAPWDDAKDAKKRKAAGAERPKIKAVAAPEPDDEDEEETPARGAKGKGKGETKGKTRDEEPEADTDELIEAGVEALIAALEEETPIKLADLDAAVRAQLTGNPQAKAIAAAICDPDELDKEKGWTFNGKRVDLA